MDTVVKGTQANWRSYVNPQQNDSTTQIIDSIYAAAALRNKEDSCVAILGCILNHFETLAQIDNPDSLIMPTRLQEAIVVYLLKTKDDNLPLSQNHINAALISLKGLITLQQSEIITRYQQHNRLFILIHGLQRYNQRNNATVELGALDWLRTGLAAFITSKNSVDASSITPDDLAEDLQQALVEYILLTQKEAGLLPISINQHDIITALHKLVGEAVPFFVEKFDLEFLLVKGVHACNTDHHTNAQLDTKSFILSPPELYWQVIPYLSPFDFVHLSTTCKVIHQNIKRPESRRYMLKVNDQVDELRNSGKTDKEIFMEYPKYRLDQYITVDDKGKEYLEGFSWYTIEKISNCQLTYAKAVSLKCLIPGIRSKNMDMAKVENRFGASGVDLFLEYCSPCVKFWPKSIESVELDVVLFMHSEEGKKYFSAELNRNIFYAEIANQGYGFFNESFLYCLCLFKDKVIQHHLDLGKLRIEHVLAMKPFLLDSHLFHLVSLLGDEVLQQYLDQGELTDRQLSLMKCGAYCLKMDTTPIGKNFLIKFAATLLLHLIDKEIDPRALKQLFEQHYDWYQVFSSKLNLRYGETGRLDLNGFLKMMEKVEALCLDDSWRGPYDYDTLLNLLHELIKQNILTPKYVSKLSTVDMFHWAEDGIQNQLLSGGITIDRAISDYRKSICNLS